MSAINVVHMLTVCMAVAAGVLAVLRISRGPTLLDRAIANDVLTASGTGLLGVMIVVWARDDLSSILVIFALTAFLTSVVIARFASRESPEQRRILTPEEARLRDMEREIAIRAAQKEESEEAAREAELLADISEKITGAKRSGSAKTIDAQHTGESENEGRKS